ncbi:19508_t:CDS:1 [Dentiscutata erythropus]|uniref:19508_t:CDS:1 n=1 Tax=Dentiscutata erythropus TaxID=1348616 RepID=A0A9N9BHX4_9GLOM|nr:19508_t:CDS:1 [Dentiscutata erythropus]
MDNLTVKNVIKLVITQICTQMDLNQPDNEDVIEHISRDLSPEEQTSFINLTTELNSHKRRDDYKIESMILDGCDFTIGLTAKIKHYISERSRRRNDDNPANVFTDGHNFP